MHHLQNVCSLCSQPAPEFRAGLGWAGLGRAGLGSQCSHLRILSAQVHIQRSDGRIESIVFFSSIAARPSQSELELWARLGFQGFPS